MGDLHMSPQHNECLVATTNPLKVFNFREEGWLMRGEMSVITDPGKGRGGSSE